MVRRSRFPGWLTLLLLMLGGAFCVSAAAARPPALRIEGLGKGTVKLDGHWEFRTGDDLAWAAPDLEDTGWTQIRADTPWGSQPGYEGYTGYAWYRRRVEITTAPGVAPDLALLIRHIDDAYELYWNGQRIGSNGKLPPHPVWYNDQAPQTFGLGPVRSGVLAVRVWKAPFVSFDNGDQGGFQEPPVVGSPSAIAALKASFDYSWMRSRQFLFALDALYALVALLCLLAWLRDRTLTIVFWMGLFAIVPILLAILDSLRLLWPFDISLALQQPLYSLEDISLWFMLLWLLQLEEIPWVVVGTRIVTAISLSATVLDGLVAWLGWTSSHTHVMQIGDATFTAIFTFCELYSVFLVNLAVVRLRRRRLDPARRLVALFAFLAVMMSVIQVAAAQGSRFTHWTLAQRISSPILTINGNAISPYTLFRTLLVLALIFAVYRYYADTQARRAALEQDIQSARELQQVLIPESLPVVAGYRLTSAYRPAQEVGGDFFQIIPITRDSSDPSTLVVLGDVSGKGLRAAMAVSMIVGGVRALAEIYPDPAELLAQLNQTLCGKLQSGFATCLALRLYANGRCQIASAGHPAPFLEDEELCLDGSLPLGLVPLAPYSESEFQLASGQHLALYTDGLLEARSASGELYGFPRLEILFAAQPTAEQATEAAVDFGQDDDITVLTLTRL